MREYVCLLEREWYEDNDEVNVMVYFKDRSIAMFHDVQDDVVIYDGKLTFTAKEKHLTPVSVAIPRQDFWYITSYTKFGAERHREALREALKAEKEEQEQELGEVVS